MPWEWPIGALLAFLLAVVTTPAGVSGAVLLLPVQLSLLGVPSPAVTPTNLVFNALAVPGGLARFGREGRLGGSLTVTLVLGSLPGVVVGAVLRVRVLADAHAFAIVAGGLLLVLGLWLLVGVAPAPRARVHPSGAATLGLWSLACVIGVAGGVYGIGGGSLIAPVLLAVGCSARQVAPATLTATFLTSLAGIATFAVLDLTGEAGAAPDWGLGLWLGAGGLLGSYLGAHLQSRLPETALRRLLGLLACAVAARYLQQGASGRSEGPAGGAGPQATVTGWRTTASNQ